MYVMVMSNLAISDPYTLRIQVPELHPAQEEVKAHARRYNVVICGRRWGKTTLAMDLLIEAALGKEAGVPTTGQPVGYFAPEYKILFEVWERTKAILAPITTRKLEDQHRIHLISGGVIEMWTLDGEGAGRSRRYARVVIDEAALVRNLRQKWQADIRPTLTDLQGDAWFLSTPRAMDFLWELWQRGQDPSEPDWYSVTKPTITNPFIPAEEIERARRELPERVFAQEYLGEFRRAEGLVYPDFSHDRHVVDPFEIPDSWERFIGLDHGWNNPEAILFAARSPDDVLYIYGEVYERERTVPEIAALASRIELRPATVYHDPSARAHVEELRRHLPGHVYRPAPNDVLAGINEVATRLRTDRLRFFRGTTPHTLTEMEGYVWEVDRGSDRVLDRPLKEHDHAMDALRYLCAGIADRGGWGLL